MNGDCKSYRLNDPMAWKEFKSMPDDLKVTYINLIRGKYGATDRALCEMFGVSDTTVCIEMKRLGINTGRRTGTELKWDKEGFYAWLHGVDKPSEPAIEEPTQEEKEAIFFGEEKGYVEDDLPFEEPDPIPVDDFMKFKAVPVPVSATPINGSMNFKCPADQALNMLAQVLGNANCAISVMWKVIEEGGEEDA